MGQHGCFHYGMRISDASNFNKYIYLYISVKNYDNLPCMRTVKIGSVWLTDEFTRAARPVTLPALLSGFQSSGTVPVIIMCALLFNLH